MAADTPVMLDVDARGVATATLNRPEVGNAYDEAMLAALSGALDTLARDERVRALVLRGAGRHFQAGADIRWLAKAGQYDAERANAASLATVRAMQALNELPKPVLAVIQGACFGGGCGLACCADIVLATPAASFGLTEVRVGVAPTPISTYVVDALGARHARRYAITGERFDAAEALRIGMVHEVVDAAGIETRLAEILDAIFLSAPGAIAVTKASLLESNGLTLAEPMMARLAKEGWMQRNSPEGVEGTAAFREKRKPNWYMPPSAG